MPTRGSLPNTNTGLLLWSSNFIKNVGATEDRYGISIEQFEAYRALHESFALAQREASAPKTRTGGTVIHRNETRTALKAEARLLVRFIRGQKGVTDQQCCDLGITVPQPRTPVGAPETAPTVRIRSVDEHRIHIRLTDPTTLTGAKPSGVTGALIYLHAGESLPTRSEEWQFHGQMTRNRLTIDLGHITNAMTVWIKARWYNPRGIPGPQSDACHANLPAIGASPAAVLSAA